jgi:hypothetical protein
MEKQKSLAARERLMELWRAEHEAVSWTGFPEEQKHEIDGCIPGIHRTVERLAQGYFRTLRVERIGKERARILGLCASLRKKLNDADLAFYFPDDDEMQRFREALDKIARKAETQDRQAKHNANQEARSHFMGGLLNVWLKAGRTLGGANSPMVAFIRAAWPKPLFKHCPSPQAIAQWAYNEDEQKQNRRFQWLLRIHD